MTSFADDVRTPHDFQLDCYHWVGPVMVSNAEIGRVAPDGREAPLRVRCPSCRVLKGIIVIQTKSTALDPVGESTVNVHQHIAAVAERLKPAFWPKETHGDLAALNREFALLCSAIAQRAEEIQR